MGLADNGILVPWLTRGRSETDLESLASFTTHQSSSSYGPAGGYPSQRLSSGIGAEYGGSSGSLGLGFMPHGSEPNPMRQRKLSSYSREGTESLSVAPGSPVSSAGPDSRDPGQAHLRLPSRFSSSTSSPQTSSPVSELDRERRRVRREARRREKEKKSTLVGEKYDSPLRSWLRWMSAQNLSGRYAVLVGCAAIGMVKTAVGFGGFSGHGELSRSVSGCGSLP